jgi:Flp pilus assembly protein TadG
MSVSLDRGLKKEDGVALVELALILPFLILIIMGIFDLGWAIYAKNTIAMSAREGARKGIISGNSDSTIRTQVKNTSIGLNLTDSQITISPSPSRSAGNPIIITVSYTYTPVSPWINMFGPGSGWQLRSQASMIVE